MLTSFWTAAALLVAGVAAQGDQSFPPGFNPGAVDQDTRNSWCLAQTNTCPKICGGYASVNRCDETKLTYSCKCGNGTEPDVGAYINTLPTFICNENFKQCIENHPDDLDGQKACKDAQKECGTLNATAESGSSSPTGTGMATRTSAVASMTGTSSATGSSQPTETNAAMPIQALAQNYSLAGLAIAFFGVFGFLL